MDLSVNWRILFAKVKEFAAKFKASANSFAPDGGQTLQKQVCFKA